jgi:hypothetical protein
MLGEYVVSGNACVDQAGRKLCRDIGRSLKNRLKIIADPNRRTITAWIRTTHAQAAGR